MCTVTYISPRAGQFVLSSNRDESPNRSVQSITQENDLLFPRDPGAGGTWICAASNGQVLCLLNGAFEAHVRKAPYRRSRGLMVLDFFNYPSALDFFKTYPFEGIEPFTLIACDGQELWEFRWDGENPHLKELDPREAYIWSSATLYPAEIREKRLSWFENWLQNQPLSAASLLEFHQTAGEGDHWNDVVMDRNGVVKTVSITQVQKNEDSLHMHYFDLLTAVEQTAQMPLRRGLVESH
jgi:uncharacterized protein with NRDE domain